MFHGSIEPQAVLRIDTHQWVFCFGAPAAMLECVESRTRALLTWSLSALLLLMAAAGGASLFQIERASAREAAIRARQAERSARLERVRSGILLSGTLARDYFAEPDSALLDKLHELESQTAPDAGIAVNLHGEIVAYWRLLNLMADLAGSRRTAGVDAYFRRQLAERRETMLAIAADIAAALDRERTASEEEAATRHRRFRFLLGAELAVAMAAGLLLSGVALRRMARLEGEARDLSSRVVRAQEEERRSIARELHDDVGQALSSLLLEIGSAAHAESTVEARVRLASAAATAENAVEAARRIALALRPSMLDDLGLVPALEWQAREVGGRTGLSVEVVAEESAGDVPESQRTCIYRVAQEALRNCARHAGATAVRVGLARSAHMVSLSVEDNGRGFLAERTRGLGLLGMEERVTQLGGRFGVRSESGKGTTVFAELPI
jgi:signal transduction histidine kinase